MPIERVLIRHNELIDPHLQIWGWEIPVYLFLGGLAVGLMILAALLGLRAGEQARSPAARRLPLIALGVISAGMLALFLDLEFKLHVFRFYLAFRVTSPMSWGSWILLAIYPATLLLGLAELTPEELRRLREFSLVRTFGLSRLVGRLHEAAAGAVAGLRWANLLLGIALGGYTGVLLGTLGARAAWSSALLGPLFLVSGFSTGAALVMLLPVSKEEHHLLRAWDLTAIVGELILLGLYLITLATGTAGARAAAGLFLGGPYTAPFWALVIITGLVVPLALELLEARRKLAPAVVAPLLLLVGGLALRWTLVLAGQAGI
jgi:formate-dependent nitrite reductase membrane component NrfD